MGAPRARLTGLLAAPVCAQRAPGSVSVLGAVLEYLQAPYLSFNSRCHGTFFSQARYRVRLLRSLAVSDMAAVPPYSKGRQIHHMHRCTSTHGFYSTRATDSA